jgi:hypothetical protein
MRDIPVGQMGERRVSGQEHEKLGSLAATCSRLAYPRYHQDDPILLLSTVHCTTVTYRQLGDLQWL